jgi:hypothetical protein
VTPGPVEIRLSGDPAALAGPAADIEARYRVVRRRGPRPNRRDPGVRLYFYIAPASREGTPPVPDIHDQVSKALDIAGAAVWDGEHHKNWVIDQMVRALTFCPDVTATATGANGQPYSYQTQGESGLYRAFVASRPGWHAGTAP